MKKIAITGANGYLASLIQKENKGQFEFIPITRKELSLDDPNAVSEYFEKLAFDIVVHTAANASTADCENNFNDTHKINTQSTIAIANICKRRKKRMIFFGTEQSFNGQRKEGPFTEEDSLISITNYGKQKMEADLYIQGNLEDYLILRFSWMMGMAYPGIKASPNIIKNVMDALYRRKPTLFTVNEVRGITYAKHLATQFSKIIAMDSGVYHFSSTNHMNTYECAKLIARKLQASEEQIAKYLLANTERYADRFRDYRLSNTKVKQQGIHLSTFEEDVEECLRDFGWL